MPAITHFSRRAFVRSLACGCVAGPAALAGASRAFAADPVAKTTLSSAEVLAKLKEGNAAFVKGGSCIPAGGAAQIAALASGQAPFAVVVACSDSRTPPEHIFNAGLGELFIIRVAGNTVDATALGSVEYGVVVLGAPLVLVLGHSQCGAVEAAVKMVTEGASYPGSIEDVVTPILPAVLRAQKQPGDLLSNAVRTNVENVADHLNTSSSLLSQARDKGKLQIVGGVYDLAAGTVDFMA